MVVLTTFEIDEYVFAARRLGTRRVRDRRGSAALTGQTVRVVQRVAWIETRVACEGGEVPSVSGIRGSAKPVNHNARTIAALTMNPGCSRRAVLDTAGVDKLRLAGHVGFPARFGQSQFAIVRGNAFEAQLKADGCAELLRLLQKRLELSIPDASYVDLGAGCAGSADEGSAEGRQARNSAARQRLASAAKETEAGEGIGTLLDHPLLTLEVAGQRVYLEPDLIAFQSDGQLHVVEIKSFAVIDDQADPVKVAAAATQAAVYVLALRGTLEDAGYDVDLVSTDAVLVCPENFANRPVATLVDVRRQLAVLRRQLARMARVEDLLAALPDDLTFDLGIDEHDVATRPAAELIAALETVPARYAPECLASCELAGFCRAGARATTAALGRTVREDLGGVERVATALGFASGTLAHDASTAEAAGLLRAAALLRAEALG